MLFVVVVAVVHGIFFKSRILILLALSPVLYQFPLERRKLSSSIWAV